MISSLRTSAVLRVSAVYPVLRIFYRRVAEDRRGTQRMWQTQTLLVFPFCLLSGGIRVYLERQTLKNCCSAAQPVR